MIGLKNFVEKGFNRFGVNKKTEIARLAYEISRRDNVSYKNILKPLLAGDPSYQAVKKALLKRRFPYSSNLGAAITPYLPKVEIEPKNALVIDPSRSYPRNIYVEERVANGYLIKRLKSAFPNANLRRIDLLKNFLETRAVRNRDRIPSYNKRLDNFFVVKEMHDFFKKCPCTKSAISCGYHIFNLGFGCVFECTYCYLQEYTNCPGIILPSNIEDFFSRFAAYKRPKMRVGTGEFTDSLALDDITQYSIPLIEFFSKNKAVTFEFKTKSGNIGNLLKTKHAGNIVVSWSLSPEKIIKENEFYTASLEKRLNSASRCARAGYKIGLHFDPIIYYNGWGRGYLGLINRIFDEIEPKDIAWLSLGTLRFNPHLKTIIENRFSNNRILDEELLLGFDKKLRYPAELRYSMYRTMLSAIRRRAKNLYVYLCMEDRDIMSICS